MHTALKALESELRGHRTLAAARGIEAQALESAYAISVALHLAGQHQQARTSLEALCLYDHENPKYWRALGACRSALGDYTGAAGAYACSAGTAHNADPELDVAMAECLAAAQENTAAATVLERIGNDAPPPVRKRAQTLRNTIGDERGRNA